MSIHWRMFDLIVKISISLNKTDAKPIEELVSWLFFFSYFLFIVNRKEKERRKKRDDVEYWLISRVILVIDWEIDFFYPYLDI